MRQSFRLLAALSTAVWVAFAVPMSTAHARGDAGATSETWRALHTPADAAAAALTPHQRGELARRFVLKWGVYVQRVYGVPVATWSARMVSNFATGDPANFRNALERTTFEGAMAELTGRGHRMSDQRAVESLVQAALSGRRDATAKVLGDVSGDLVYTPLQPCRIVDTRITSEGEIFSTRSFFALSSDFSSQGGSAGDCGTSTLTGVGAVAINVTAVAPFEAGYATVFPFNTAQPLASSLNYRLGTTTGNMIITGIPNPRTTHDFTIFTYARAHYVVDLVGYFSAPQATALQCVQGTLASVDIPANGSATLFSPLCPTGYARVGTSCDTSSSFAYLTIVAIAGCQARNTTGTVQTVNAQATCCRVPGR